MGCHQDSDLVERASIMTKTLPGVLPNQAGFHTNRDSQYTSGQLHKTAKRHGIKESMGRTGVCFDNAIAESFWSTLKHRFYHRHTWPTRAQARREVARWIELVYNQQRHHSSLGFLHPVELEQTMIESSPSKVEENQAAYAGHVHELRVTPSPPQSAAFGRRPSTN